MGAVDGFKIKGFRIARKKYRLAVPTASRYLSILLKEKHRHSSSAFPFICGMRHPRQCQSARWSFRKPNHSKFPRSFRRRARSDQAILRVLHCSNPEQEHTDGLLPSDRAIPGLVRASRFLQS